MKRTLIPLLGICLSATAWAQSSCSSDGQPQALALVERFLSADCVACWSAPQPDLQRVDTLVLDWIVPSTQADDAPLSAAASRDALARLQALGHAAPTTTLMTRQSVAAGGHVKLRLAQGLAIVDYIGASIDITRARNPGARQPWTVWLALVESLPSGAEGTPVPRNLVRNLFQAPWHTNGSLPPSTRRHFSDLRPMQFAEGASPARLRLVGWIQDAQGRVLTATQTVCPPEQ